MGADLFDRRPDLLGERSDEILGWSLRETCLNGPEELLTRTEHAQPALFAVAYALWDELAAALPLRPEGAAGHSLGEYTALAASGALSYDVALGVVSSRGRAMADAADLEPSGMAALLGADVELAKTITEERKRIGGRLQIANINAPGQIVVAGGKDDIAWLTDKGGDLGVRRVVPLKVAGAFHSTFMEPAGKEVEATLALVEISHPSFPVWSNTTAEPHEPGQIRTMLGRQVVSTVRFSESLQSMADTGIGTFLHVGPGDVTAGMAKRSVPGAEAIAVSVLEDIPSAVESIGTMT